MGLIRVGSFGFFALLLLLALTGCGENGVKGKVVYTSDENGNPDIYISTSDSKALRLTKSPANDHSPQLSPDGKQVAFVSDRDGDSDIFVVQTTGEKLFQITVSPEDESSPRWSPDGKMLALLTLSPDGSRHILVTEVEEPQPHRLTTGDMDEGPPAWAPDGKWIAFSLTDDQGEGQGIFLRNPGGVNQIPLTTGPDFVPTWSPDSQRVAFQSTRDGNTDIYIADLGDGVTAGEPRRLTNRPAPDYSPTWSPKGDWIAFISERDENPEVYIASPDGTLVERLTINQVIEEGIVWSEDGHLAFVSHLHGNADIFVMDLGEGTQSQVTLSTAADTQPDW